MDSSDGENSRRDGSLEKDEDEIIGRNINNSKIVNSGDGQSKQKRQMKTPYQLEALEKAYALETYPTESTRAELSDKLGLTDRQLQMWFCHRRLRDKKDLPSKKQKKLPSAVLDSTADNLKPGPEFGNDYGSGSASGSSPIGRPGSSLGMARYRRSPQSLLELRAVAFVEAQLGEPLRKDGPILGIEFDPLPPDAFGAPLEQQKRPGLADDAKLFEQHNVKPNKTSARALREYQYFQNQPSIRSDNCGQLPQSHLRDPILDGDIARTPSDMPGTELLPKVHTEKGHSSRFRHVCQQDKQLIAWSSPALDDDYFRRRDSVSIAANTGMNAHYNDHSVVKSEPQGISAGQTYHNDTMPNMSRKRKIEDSKSSIEAEAYEIKVRKELEKQEIMRQKNEERMKKEIERQDRERRKEEERLMRERQREEERLKREEKRETERREKLLLKEHLRAEKIRQKEEIRKEKEAERRKVALEKANARRLAKESMELIEDEQLELMELAAAKKGVSSIIHLDLEALQNLEAFRDSLCLFPLGSIKLKKPFAIQPWVNSDKNTSNLLMVWRFLIAFADVLGIWPFTLDEFIQAVHDYDSRLLGEIHVALLKVIIKDIEDVARTPTTVFGANQNGANLGGGHPEIVEGAHAWGFDIRTWQQHLNPLTWPEILRQLALSAGFGPRLKKQSTGCQNTQAKDEVPNCEDTISTLRNGTAAEKAFAKMRERGLLAPPRSRHRLTPGTVKFAAFHVLSLEGSEGLNVLDLAEKIQKSGLRDLTSSKTPEASISVAMSRDAKLFERIAPSTYRVRDAYRKDPVDAEAILSEARKKIQMFENGIQQGEDADDVERDEESESDSVDEDPEVDLLITSNGNKINKHNDDTITSLDHGKENLSNEIDLNTETEFEKDVSFSVNGNKNVDCLNTAIEPPVKDIPTKNLDPFGMEIDESISGESWIQGLTEGDYSVLSVEERLNALVALIGVANEGHSIRVVLEDRFEAANALKKQMWAEAQLDKRCIKDDILYKLDNPSVSGNRIEPQYPVMEGTQSPVHNGIIITSEESPRTLENQKLISTPQYVQNPLAVVPYDKALFADINLGSDNFPSQQLGYASKRSRSQMKSYIAQKAEEVYIYRSLPLGQDRRHNRYWQFITSASSNDPGAGRIFVELQDRKWRLIDSQEDFDILLKSLDARGIRESHLLLMLQKIESTFKENVRINSHSAKYSGLDEGSVENKATEAGASPDQHAVFDSSSSIICHSDPDELETSSSSSFKVELGRYDTEKKAAMQRYQDFQKWMWKECYSPSNLCATKYGKKRGRLLIEMCDVCFNSYYFERFHCPYCHRTTSITRSNASKHACQCGEKKPDPHDTQISAASLPLQIRLLKSLLANIEVSVPMEAFRSIWNEAYRKHWGKRLSISSSPEELLQILTLLERALQREYISPNFPTTEESLGLGEMPACTTPNFSDLKFVPVIPWVPQTIAALALRLLEFDASISYTQLEKHEPDENREAREYTKLHSRYATMKTETKAESAYIHNEYVRERTATKSKSGRNSHKHGRGKKSSRRMNGSKCDTKHQKVSSDGNLSHGRYMHGQQGSWGRRTVRKRTVEEQAVEDLLLRHKTATPVSKADAELLRSLAEEREGLNNSMQMELGDNSNSSEEVQSDDNGQAVEYEQGNWEIGFNGSSSRWGRGLIEPSDEEMDASEDDNDIEDGRDQNADLARENLDDVTNHCANEGGTESAVSEDSYE